MLASLNAKTWSPTSNFLTSLPTDSMTPASSDPSMGCFGFRDTKYQHDWRAAGTLRTSPQSPDVTVVACVLSGLHCSWALAFRSLLTEEHRATHIFHTQLLSMCYHFLRGALIRISPRCPTFKVRDAASSAQRPVDLRVMQPELYSAVPPAWLSKLENRYRYS